MLSPAAATSPTVIPKHTTPSTLLSDCSSTSTSVEPVQLVDISVTPAPVNLQKSTSPPLPLSAPCSIRKPPSSIPPQNSKPSVPRHHKAKAPKPTCPPLPVQQPSAIPKTAATAMSKAPPRPISKPLSSPLQRPPPPLTSKTPVVPSPAVPTQTSAHPSISILEKLIKTCPVWLQLGMTKERATQILTKELPGVKLYTYISCFKYKYAVNISAGLNYGFTDLFSEEGPWPVVDGGISSSSRPAWSSPDPGLACQ